MAGMNILWILLIGLAAGAIAGALMRGKGFGIIINILVGIAGSFVGGWIYGLLGISIGSGIWGVLLMAVVGAVVLLWVLSLFKKK